MGTSSACKKPAPDVTPKLIAVKAMSNSNDPHTNFGFEKVSFEQKTQRVGQVFDSVAERYDLMNDLMSFGLHRLWKRAALELSGVKPGDRVLDIAGGTGDLTRLFSRLVGTSGEVVLADINAAMLKRGRARLIDDGLVDNICYVRADAEQLPFQDCLFDCICIAFGLRNVTHKENALQSFYGALKPGGRLIVLEFSKPVLPLLNQLYDFYSFRILPKIGEWIAQDRASYQYLAESIRMHPDQTTLKQMIDMAGFERSDFFNLSGGIVALHRGFKL